MNASDMMRSRKENNKSFIIMREEGRNKERQKSCFNKIFQAGKSYYWQVALLIFF